MDQSLFDAAYLPTRPVIKLSPRRVGTSRGWNGVSMIMERIREPGTSFETLERRFSETTDANERMELLREMCALVQMAYVILKSQLSEFWH